MGIGKNTFSKMQNSSGCSDYLDRRVTAGTPYLGMGLGAQSFSQYTLQYNLGAVTKKLGQYLRSTELGRLPIQDLYHLSKPQALAKFCAVSFYFGGIDLQHFRNHFGAAVQQQFQPQVA